MCALKSIRDLCRCGMAAAEKGDHEGANFLLRQALRQAGALSSPVLEAKILNSMGIVRLLQGRTADAAPFLTSALDKVERRAGKSNRLYAVIAANLSRAVEKRTPA